jgi:hypothetical protein
MISELVPGAGPTKIAIGVLQERLGVLAFAQAAGEELRQGAAGGLPLPPPPWLLLQSRSQPGEAFYFNPTTREACWELPSAPSDPSHAEPTTEGFTAPGNAAHAEAEGQPPGVQEGGEGALQDDSNEEVPMPSSRLATAKDCAAVYAGQGQTSGRGTPRWGPCGIHR